MHQKWPLTFLFTELIIQYNNFSLNLNWFLNINSWETCSTVPECRYWLLYFKPNKELQKQFHKIFSIEWSLFTWKKKVSCSHFYLWKIKLLFNVSDCIDVYMFSCWFIIYLKLCIRLGKYWVIRRFHSDMEFPWRIFLIDVSLNDFSQYFMYCKNETRVLKRRQKENKWCEPFDVFIV